VTTDPSGLIYLRARYYAPTEGRFISRDSWGGDYNKPLSFNRWNYVEGNPVNLTDPSGHDPYWCDYYKDEQKRIQCWVAYITSLGQLAKRGQIFPTPTCSPTAIPTPTGTPTPSCPVCYSNPNALMFLNAVLKHQSELRPGFSVALLLAMGSWESGHQHNWSNSTVQGGVLQLRPESGIPFKIYPDTQEGYDSNVEDALTVINSYYDAAPNAEGFLFDYIYLIYPDNKNGVTAARSVLYYNGDIGWWKGAYIQYPENIPYLENVARELRSYVPTFFGYRDDALVTIMGSIQNLVYCQMRRSECRK